MNIINWREAALGLASKCSEQITQSAKYLTETSVMRTDGQTNPVVRNEGDRKRMKIRNTKLLGFLTQLESYLVSLQSLLIWENPYLSAVAFVGLNCFFWVIVSWTRRFYSILSLITFTITFYKLWTNYIWPEIRVPPNLDEDNEGWTPLHPKVLSPQELNSCINEAVNMLHSSLAWLIHLRSTQPGLFCLLITGLLMMTAIVGKIIPGVIIAYIAVMTAALGPGIVLYVIPSNWISQIRKFLQITKEEDEEEKLRKELEGNFCPATTPEKIHELYKEHDLNEHKDDENDSPDESLQLLPPHCLEETFSGILGTCTEENDDDISVGKESLESSKSRSSVGSSNGGGMKFVSNHFVSQQTDDDEDYELISDSEVNETPVDASAPTKYLHESDL